MCLSKLRRIWNWGIARVVLGTLGGSVAGFLALSISVGRPAEAPNGGDVFTHHCAPCHSPGSGTGATDPDILRKMTKEQILQALQSGVMKPQGSRLTASEQIAVAEFLGNVETAAPKPLVASCHGDPTPPASDIAWLGWGVDTSNTRFQPRKVAGITPKQVPSLQLKWAFGFPGAWATYGQPSAYGGRIYEGSEDGTVYSLDAQSGCIYWTFKAAATVKTAVAFDPEQPAAFFGDTVANIYAIDTQSGRLLWKQHVDPHPAARITGSPVFANHHLYVPVSSGEEGAAIDPKYPCCTFRGSLMELDPRTGEPIWKSYTIPNPAEPRGRANSAGTQMWGPSGAAVWSSPTVDVKRHAVYVATGNSYSDPPSSFSDAVLAFDLDTGKRLWSRQLSPNDRWNISCIATETANCPEGPGNDFDFGAPPILKSLPNGRTILLAAQKSGVVYGLDPDRKGAIVWQRRIARGGPLGGIQWGGAADDSLVFYPRSDWEDSKIAAGGGLFALQIESGEVAWFQPPASPKCPDQPGCSAAQMAPTTAIPGVVFSGSLDGHLRAYETQTGKLIWDFDTARPFKTINGVEARGGSLVATGPLVVGGMLYINSGYTNAIPGNVLLAFEISGAK